MDGLDHVVIRSGDLVRRVNEWWATAPSRVQLRRVQDVLAWGPRLFYTFEPIPEPLPIPYTAHDLVVLSNETDAVAER